MEIATITTVIRYILVAIGSVLTARGIVDEQTVEMIVGAILTLVTAGYGIYITNKKNKIVAQAKE